MRQFKKGDEVEYIGETSYGLVYGMHGTVLGYPKKGKVSSACVSFVKGNMHVVVAFPNTVRNTWDCDGIAPEGNGLYIGERYLKKVKEK